MKLLQFKKEIKFIYCLKELCEILNINRLDYLEFIERNINENIFCLLLGCIYRIYNNVMVFKMYEVKKGINVIMYIFLILEY